MATRNGIPRIGVFSRTLGQASMPSQRHADFVRSVEGLGYRMLWLSEAFGREALTHAAVVLARTRSLTVGTGIANVWGRDAMAMANGARTLGEAYPGRFVLGIGISHNRIVASRAHTYRAPLETLRRYLEEMDSAEWTGPPLPVRVPRVVGALGPRALRLSADLADGAHPYLVTPSHTASARDLLGPEALLAPEQSVVLANDADVARAAARKHLSLYLRLENYRRSFIRQGFTEDDVAGGGSDRLVDAIVAWGDEGAIVSRIRRHLQAGADHVAIQALPCHSADDPIRTLKAIAPLIAEGRNDGV